MGIVGYLPLHRFSSGQEAREIPPLLGLWPGDRLLAGHPFLFHVSHRIEAQLSAVHKSREWPWGAHMNHAFPQMFPPFSNFVLTKTGELFQ